MYETIFILGTQCCELMGTAFQLMESEKDAANFILESGSGNQILDPFDFAHYSPPNDIPSPSSQPTSHIAGFIRFTSQELPSIQNPMPLALKGGPVVSAADIGDGKGATNDPDVGGSVVGASFQPITVSSKVQPIPYTNDIHLTASMTNQNGGLDPLTTPLDQLQNTIPMSQKARRPLLIPPTVPVPMVSKSIPPAGVEVARVLADWQPDFEEHTSPSQRNRTAGSHALNLNQIATGGDGGAQLPAETLQHHDPSNPVWRSPSKPLFQAADDVVGSDEDESGSYYSAIDESGSYYSAVDEPEMHMPVMLPQTSGQFNSFLKQHEHNSLNSNLNPINFVIKKMMKARRIAHSTNSTSGSSMKVDTDSFISRFSESAENFSPVSLSTSWL